MALEDRRESLYQGKDQMTWAHFKKLTSENFSDRPLPYSHEDKMRPEAHSDLQEPFTIAVPIKVALTYMALVS